MEFGSPIPADARYYCREGINEAKTAFSSLVAITRYKWRDKFQRAGSQGFGSPILAITRPYGREGINEPKLPSRHR